MIGTQLPKDVTNCDLLLQDDDWIMQEKFDGIRLPIYKDEDGDVYCTDRNGVQKATPGPLRELLEYLSESESVLARNTFIDGEYLSTGRYKAFDLVDLNSLGSSEVERFCNLLKISFWIGLDHPVDVVGTTVYGQKADRFRGLMAQGAEGVVFKRRDSPYTSGKHSDWKKFKFVKDVDCVVTAKSIDGKDNLELSLVKPEGIVPVGKCSALTGDGPRVKVGDVVTVTYLYVTKSGRLYQPVKPRLRTDKNPAACLASQLII